MIIETLPKVAFRQLHKPGNIDEMGDGEIVMIHNGSTDDDLLRDVRDCQIAHRF